MERRKPVRRDPEKRRQQNIEAQRRYRQRIRQRLQTLEALSGTILEDFVPIQRGSVSEPYLSDDVALSCGQSQQSRYNPPISSAPAALSTNSFSNDCLSTRGVLDAMKAPVTSIAPSSAGSWLATSAPMAHVVQSQTPAPEQENGEPLTYIDPSVLVLPIDKGIRKRAKQRSAQEWTTTVVCRCNVPHSQVQRCTDGSIRLTQIVPTGFDPGQTTFSPYRNHLRLQALCTLNAMEVLKSHVGIPDEMICVMESGSPLFRRHLVNSGGISTDGSVSQARLTFKALKPDLRPNAEQIAIDHSPYIDSLPFPTLRKNLILQQNAFDEHQFLQDLVIGLICWGSEGDSSSKRQASTIPNPSSSPWDTCSWEAQLWFLRKYWDILGGQDGELVRQSAWWRNMRGEEPLDTDTWPEPLQI